MAVFDRIAAGGLLNNASSTAAVTRTHFHLRSLAALALVAILAACGGDDGDDTGQPPTAPGQPAPQPSQPGHIAGRVLSAGDGQPVAGATVTVGGSAVTTGADGSFTFTDLTQVDRLAVTITAPGYAPTVRITSVTGSTTTTVPTQLLPLAATVSLDAAAGGTVTVPGSTAQVVFPAGAVVTATGAAPTQPVLVQLTPINPAFDPNLMPGDFHTTSSGTAAWLESFGALSVVLTDAAGGSYNLAAGQSATIRIPAATRAGTLPPTIPLYGFNETTGLWERSGTATLGGTAPNQYYEGTVARITTWNAEDTINTVRVLGCVEDPAGRRVPRARVELDGVTYSGTSNALTDRFGNFSVPMRRDASAALSARSSSQLSNTRGITTASSTVNLGTNCLVFAEGAIGIKLTWGRAPTDVDSHVLTPHGTHISYVDKGSLAAAPYVNLDIDDTTSFGPEIVTILRPAHGTYRYFLHNYSNTFGPGMTASPVKVEVTYNGNTSVFTPAAGEGTLRNWHAFDIVVDTQCAVTITPVNTWSAANPANPNPIGGVITYCN
jgi:hypothetical protein